MKQFFKKIWLWIAGAFAVLVGIILWQKDELEEKEEEIIGAETDKKDALLEKDIEHVDEKIDKKEKELDKDVKDLDKEEVEDYWNKENK